jgi:hypothetical protein
MSLELRCEEDWRALPMALDELELKLLVDEDMRGVLLDLLLDFAADFLFVEDDLYARCLLPACGEAGKTTTSPRSTGGMGRIFGVETTGDSPVGDRRPGPLWCTTLGAGQAHGFPQE